MRRSNGIIGHAANQSVDNPSVIVVYHQAESIETLQAFLANPDLKEVMEAAGVTSEPEVWRRSTPAGGGSSTSEEPPSMVAPVGDTDTTITISARNRTRWVKPPPTAARMNWVTRRPSRYHQARSEPRSVNCAALRDSAAQRHSQT